MVEQDLQTLLDQLEQCRILVSRIYDNCRNYNSAVRVDEITQKIREAMAKTALAQMAIC